MASRQNPRRRKRKSGYGLIILLIIILIACLSAALILHLNDREPVVKPPETTAPSETTTHTEPTTTATEPAEPTTTPTEGTTEPTEPYVVITASIGATGDILIHNPLRKSAKEYAKMNGSGSEYDFSEMFAYVSDYYSSFDYMVANLEVPLAGGEKDDDYDGYPHFNCPDDIVDALKGAGVDMLLTANNHSYDKGYDGFIRTQQVVEERGLDHIGTRLSEDVPNYLVKDINGIKVGMVCYTYDTRSETNGKITLNGIRVKDKAIPLVNTFDYSNPSGFYTEFEKVMANMEADGAEAIVMFVHWGYEYNLKPNSSQKKMAQKLCDMGVDVIVGGHPHVIQPFDTLTSENGNVTYCIYSTGNALSNQRRESLNTVDNENYTEDGMIFGVEFQKWNDGTVEVSKISILPTWVKRVNRPGGSTRIYNIIPLDTAIEDWSIFSVSPASRLRESYERTMDQVGKGLNECLVGLGLEEVPLKIN